MHILAQRLNVIDEPQTIKMAKLGRELKAQGKDIIDLSLGEPDFATPQYIKDAAIEAMDAGFTKYPPVAGYPELKQAVCHKLKRDNKLDYTIDEVMVCTGAKQCIADTIFSLLTKGDEVLIPSPYWVTYADLVRLAEGVVVEIKANVEQDFKITPQQLENAITSKTKAFIFSSPNNPTGCIYSKSELLALAEVFKKHQNIFIISDEIYEYINFESEHFSLAQVPELKDNVIIVNGLSKSFAMTGWRLGYMAASKDIIKACEKVQSQFTSGPNSITQRAAIAALNGNLDAPKKMVEAFKERRNYFFEELSKINGFKLSKPDGAFYLFPDISYYFGKKYNDYTINSALDFCMFLLHDANVTSVTGEAFGEPNCIRFSYATSMDNLKIACKRIRESVAKLK